MDKYLKNKCACYEPGQASPIGLTTETGLSVRAGNSSPLNSQYASIVNRYYGTGGRG
jgi:hypothetical protein